MRSLSFSRSIPDSVPSSSAINGSCVFATRLEYRVKLLSEFGAADPPPVRGRESKSQRPRLVMRKLPSPGRGRHNALQLDRALHKNTHRARGGGADEGEDRGAGATNRRPDNTRRGSSRRGTDWTSEGAVCRHDIETWPICTG